MRARKVSAWALANYIILASAGVLLRYMQLYPLPGFNYSFLLHAHSHFAFSAWMFLSLAFLIVKACNDEKLSRSFKPIVTLTLISSFGMLISFAGQGYKAISIGFSTLFIFLTYWFTYLIIKHKADKGLNPSSRFLLRASLFFLCLSSLGPYALAPLAANGLQDHPFYQNAIYFYIHFQMNGWMLFAALALIVHYLNLSKRPVPKNLFFLFAGSSFLLYFIFTLWSRPPVWIVVSAAAGSLVHLIVWVRLCAIFIKNEPKSVFLLNAALLAVSLKILFQILVCIPAIGEWTFANRNLIIGYIHLIALGCVSPVILYGLFNTVSAKLSQPSRFGRYFFVYAVVLSLTLLFTQPLLSLFGILIPAFLFLLLAISAVLLLAGLILMVEISATGTKEAEIPVPN